MTTVFIAEKPSQAKSYAEAFSYSKMCQGYIECRDSSLMDDNVLITWALGHLVAPVPPTAYNETWNAWKDLSVLPIFPGEFQYEVPADKKKQFSIVKQQLKAADKIVWAGDIDREGSLISYLICKEAGVLNKPTQRLWITDLLVKTVREGIQNLQSNERSMLAAKEAQTRQIADWLIGMNASPLFGKTLQELGLDGSFSIGRVMTPTLYLIYQRELAIRNFKKEKYYEVEADFIHPQGAYKGKIVSNLKFESKEAAEEFINVATNSSGQILDIQKEVKSKRSPKLYKLKTIQQKMNSSRNLSPATTLKIMQKLYEMKFLSYPRTDIHFISTANYNELKENVLNYAHFLNLDDELFQNLNNHQADKAYVNDKKVAEHYANIPTSKIPNSDEWQSLSKDEQAVYTEVQKVTLAMFCKLYEYEQTTIITRSGDTEFKTVGHVPTQEGWKVVCSSEEEKEKLETLPEVELNDVVEAQIKLLEKESKAPVKYTEGTLLTAMETAGKAIDDESLSRVLNQVNGIGTPATRADVIEKLKRKDKRGQAYIKVVKNKVELEPKAFVLCKAVSVEPLLSSAEMTGKWELFLEKIGKNERQPEEFIDGIQKFINKMIENVPGKIETLNFSEEMALMGSSIEVACFPSCPKCEGRLKDTFKAINCCSCDFKLWKKIAGKELSEKIILDLLTDYETKMIRGFKSKAGKSFNAALYIAEDFTVGFDFKK